MNNRPITYEDKMKYRDNEFLYDKCCKQYHCIINYQYKMSEYKQQMRKIKELNGVLNEQVNQLKEENEQLRAEINDMNITKYDYVKLINKVGELEEENKKLKSTTKYNYEITV